jgi:hypothetical protein
MQATIQLVLKIGRRPPLYLGAWQDISHLEALLTGYVLRAYEDPRAREDVEALFQGFGRFVAEQYQDTRSLSPGEMICRHTSSDEEAFQTYFALFQEYVEQGRQKGRS